MRPILLLALPFVLLAPALQAQAPAAHAHATAPPSPSPFSVPLDETTRARLTRHPVQTRIHDTPLHCEGVSLLALLPAAGAMPESPLRGPDLARYVLIDARDGARAIFSLGELDPSLGATAAYLVDRCEGAPLTAENGPLRLLVPDDSRGARSLRQVDSITVVAAP